MYEKYVISICDCSIIHQKCVHICMLNVNAIMLVIQMPGGTEYCKMCVYCTYMSNVKKKLNQILTLERIERNM